MESALAQIRELAASADKASRLDTIRALHRLAASLEDTEDVVNRIGYLVRALFRIPDDIVDS